MSLAVGTGAALSNLIGGFVADRFGFATAFVALSMAATAAFVVFALFMPQIRPSGESDDARIGLRALHVGKSVTGAAE